MRNFSMSSKEGWRVPFQLATRSVVSTSAHEGLEPPGIAVR